MTYEKIYEIVNAITIEKVKRMSVFGDTLKDTALDMIEAFDYEAISYVKRSANTTAGGLIADMATGGVFGTIDQMAVGGVLKTVSGVEELRTNLSALVDRKENVRYGTPVKLTGSEMLVTVVNDATNGILASEITKLKDGIMIGNRPDMTSVERRIVDIVMMDEGMVTLKVR